MLCFAPTAIQAKSSSLPSYLDEDTVLLAATLWGEMKDYNVDIRVVANTVMNRKKYYEKQNNGKASIREIVSNTDQYASWKTRNMNAEEIIREMSEYSGTDKPAWESCLNVANLALHGSLSDNTGGATGYYVSGGDVPEWARGKTETETLNNVVLVRETNTDSSTDSGSSQSSSSFAKTESVLQASQDNSSGNSCNGVSSVIRDISAKTNSGHGVISDATMENMTKMLNRIYKSLGQIFMLGHGVLCYATKVAYHCFGLDISDEIKACMIKAPHLSFFICGLAIYLTAFLMSIAIGMYFIDISFKLGFGLMYLPIAIALWPFAPTKSKFGEAFGLILHNSMLYAMMSIGLSYAILLIYNGVLGDASNWTSFWNAIEKESTEILSENFSLSSTRVIVIMFCLVFGFKIISSSVNDYLDYFFSDGLLGGQSPMHHLGTQAMAMTGGAIAGRIGGYAADVVETQAGKVVEKTGDELVALSQGNGFIHKAFGSIAGSAKDFGAGMNRLATGNFKEPTKQNPTATQQNPATPTQQSTTPADDNTRKSKYGATTQQMSATGASAGNETGAATSTATGAQTNTSGNTGTSSFNIPKDSSGAPIYAEYIDMNDSRYQTKYTNTGSSYIFDTKTNRVVQNRFVDIGDGSTPQIMDRHTNSVIKNDKYQALSTEAVAFKEARAAEIRAAEEAKAAQARAAQAQSQQASGQNPEAPATNSGPVYTDGQFDFGQNTFESINFNSSVYRTAMRLSDESINSASSPYSNGEIRLTNDGRFTFRKFAEGSYNLGKSAVSHTVGFGGRVLQGFGRSMQNHQPDNSFSEYMANQRKKEQEEQAERQAQNSVNQNDVDQHDDNR